MLGVFVMCLSVSLLVCLLMLSVTSLFERARMNVEEPPVKAVPKSIRRTP